MYSDFNYTGRGWWIAHDLVIEFDGNGKVIRYSVLSDKQFLDELPTLLSTEEHPSEFQPRSGTSFKTVNTAGREFLDLVAIDRWGEYRRILEQPNHSRAD